MNRSDLPATVGELLAAARARLADPREAAPLVAHALEILREALYAHPEHNVPAQEANRVLALVARRAAGEPVAYLTATREFYGLPLMVTPAVLIPRPETELVVDVALTYLNKFPANQRLSPSPLTGELTLFSPSPLTGEGWGEGDQKIAASQRNPPSPPSPARGEGAGKLVAPVVADLGTGSGAIALAIAHARHDARLIATDRSAAALAVAIGNAHRLGLGNVAFVHADWLAPFAARSFDLVVSNPPYVASDDPYLAQGDLRFEPSAALAAGADGLAAIRRLIAETSPCLKPGGTLILEHGADQQAAVCALLNEHGYRNIEGYRDLANLPRVVAACKPPATVA